MAATTASHPSALKGSVGQYKDIQTVRYDTNIELHGSEQFAPATYPHYLPTWDNEKGNT
jgi:sulfonate dioxygenase